MRTLSGLFLLLVLAQMAYAVAPGELRDLESDLSRALLDMGMKMTDFRIRHDYAGPDAFRLPLVDSLLQDPASLPERMDALASEIEGSLVLHETALSLWHAMSIEPATKVLNTGGLARIRNRRGSLSRLPSSLADPVQEYLGHLPLLSFLRDAVIRDARPHLDFLYANLPVLVAPSEDYGNVGPFELHRLEKKEEALNDSVLAICEDLDITAIATMSCLAIRYAEDLGSRIETALPIDPRYERYKGAEVSFADVVSGVSGTILYAGITEWGPMVIGGSSRNTYDGCFAMILDLGGDDTYNLIHQRDVNFRVLIDLEGNDVYRARDSCSVAGAILGSSVIMDLAGDDTYQAPGTSLGAGIAGAGVLKDIAGDDLYISGAFSQGAGFLGLGILHDKAGHDTYLAGMQSQAFGYVMGSGLLLETEGHDTYYTRMAQTDILRYDDHYLTLSQGCAFGSRPDYSGGIGLLIDSRGNDLYSSDIFGQGVGYWFAVGSLIDRSGHDRYCSYQYAQGAGIHLAFGLLVDESGDDAYLSKGVSQGCGHDLSLGLLADLSGNDWYTATDLSQGAGNANGTGILYDTDGSDSYASKSTVNVNGYGDYRREFGSIGVHIDKRGEDFYSARGDNNSIWESGKYGIGVDAPGEAKKPGGDLVIKDYPFRNRIFTSEELFILSSRGEPRFRAWREYAFDRMVEDSLATIAYLRTVLDTKDARERHTIKDILRKIGRPAVPMLSDAVREDNDRAQAEASWILGLIGDHDAFDSLLELSHSDRWKLRSSALSAMGKLKDLTGRERDDLATRIEDILGDRSEVFYVRKDAAFAAGGQGLCRTLPRLLDELEAEHYSARFSAAEAIRELSGADCPGIADRLIALLPQLSAAGTVAALHAAHGLPTDQKMEILEAARDVRCVDEVHVAVAMARLIRAVEPESQAQEHRLQVISKAIPSDLWQAQSLLSP